VLTKLNESLKQCRLPDGNGDVDIYS